MTIVRRVLAPLLVAGTSVFAASKAARRSRQIDFHGRVVVITGGSRGLGLILGRELAEQGARLALVARDEVTLERARQDLSERGAEVLVLPCDVGERDAVEQAVARIIVQYGRIDVLINNAGMIEAGPVEHMAIADFETAMATHFWGPLYLTLAALPYLRQGEDARVVNIASIGGQLAVPHLVPYSASKFALVGLSDGLRAELAKDGIRVTTVNPGLLRTGSPPNAQFKGRHRAEYAWFTISDALPITSIDARRAARQILDACRYGDPELTITWQAKAAILANALAPSLLAEVMGLTTRLLPRPTGADGDAARTGRESESALAPSPLTALSDRATLENNEGDGR
ncbi:MAG TPA: SDR family NAD(P)-dependent oxidoreductase [Thermomicrobiales bacterium]